MTTETSPDYTAFTSHECPHKTAEAVYVLIDEAHAPKTPVCLICTMFLLTEFTRQQGKPSTGERPRTFEIHTASAMVEAMRGREPIPCRLPPTQEDKSYGETECSHSYHVPIRPDDDHLADLVRRAHEHAYEHADSEDN